MDAHSIYPCLERVAGPSCFLFFFSPHPLSGHLVDNSPSRKPFRGMVKNFWAGRETRCNAGGNAASDGDPCVPEDHIWRALVEAQMAREQWALLVARRGGQVIQGYQIVGGLWFTHYLHYIFVLGILSKCIQSQVYSAKPNYLIIYTVTV